jgi:large subunit ribosomal protein L31e
MSASDFEERIVTVPLRAANRQGGHERTDRAMKLVREHLAKHFSVEPEEVRLDSSINETIWARGRSSPPRKIRVRAARFEEEGERIVEAEHAQ